MAKPRSDDVVTYVVFAIPGILTSEVIAARVPDRNPNRDPNRDVKVAPKAAAGFYYVDIVPRGEPANEHSLPPGHQMNISGKYFIYAPVVWVSDSDHLKPINRDGKLTTLIANMETNGWSHVIYTRTGDWCHFDRRKDQIVQS